MDCDIIIPTYENEDLTVACFESIKKYTNNFRIIWVDNGSKGKQKVQASLQGVNHIAILLPTNQGFVGAVNLGIAVSNAPFVCLLNNDTLVSPRWLEKLIKSLKADPQLGIVGALTAPIPGDRRFDSHHNVTWIKNSGKPLSFPEYRNLEDFNLRIEKQFSGMLTSVDFVAFLCAVIKREVVSKVGFLDPNYAMGLWDDCDYNNSIKKAGYKVGLLLDTCIWHKGRSTFDIAEKNGLDINALLAKNRAYLDRKWGYK